MRLKYLAIFICIILQMVSCNGGDQQSVAFLLIGDWGSGTQNQIDVADGMKAYCADNQCGFVVTAGDNFNTAITSVDDPQWTSVYSDVYGDLNLVFHPSLGNHDLRGNVQALMDRSQIDSTWYFPSEYYSFTKPDNAVAPLVEFFVLNSADYQFQEAEKLWLENALAASRASWKILVTHVPIISNGPHGDDEHGMNAELVPVICDKIDLVLSGHDHIFSYLKSDVMGCSIEQVIIGNSGAILYDVKEDSRAVSSGSFYGFGWFKVSDNEIMFNSVRSDASTYFQTTWTK